MPPVTLIATLATTEASDARRTLGGSSDAVALHLHHEIAVRRRHETAPVSAGVGLDLGDDTPPAYPTTSTPCCDVGPGQGRSTRGIRWIDSGRPSKRERAAMGGPRE
ncbi:hypothetical protein GCM10017589_33980 [Streptomyces poonensis]|nr:hypothetical protein GCM10017589_33980 [Streptomyces poonensis]